MKKITKIITYLTLLLFVLLTLSSCKDNAKKITITYETNGGSVIENIEVEEGSYIYIPSSPTKEGYKFIGWYKDAKLTNEIDYYQKVSENITIYAKWEELIFDITYILNGGINDSRNPLTTTTNTNNTALYEAIKEGYTFVGWKLNNGIITNLPSTVKEDITLEAVYEISKHTLTYITNGGNEINPSIVEHGTNITLPVPTKEGYTFEGWFTDENLTTPHNPFNAIESDLTLYAKWEENEVIYDIKYILDNGSNDVRNPNKISSKDETITLYDAKKEGYKFTGWKLNDKIVSEIPAGQTGDITLIATFEIIEYTITYILNDGLNNEQNVITYTVEDIPVKLYDATLENKHFRGWRYNNGYISNITKALMGNITLEAEFEEIYKITYTGIGSDLVDNPTEYYPSSGEIRLKTPQLEGYNFFGWNLNEYTVNKIPADSTGDLVLSTVYNYVEYNIKYILDGGINNNLNKDIYTRKNPVIYLKEPTKEGYIFMGWQLNNEIIDSFESSICKDITLVATWELAPVYSNIYYMLNGGKLPQGTKALYQEGKEHILAIPTKEGYIFKGWNTLNDGSGKTVTKIETTETGNKTYYAIWEKIVITSSITYELNGGEFTDEVKYTYEEGTEYLLPIPKKDNHTFVGWYVTSNFTDSGITSITENTVGDQMFYAKWESNIPTYNITYVLNGGEFAKETLYNTRTEMVNDFINDINSYYVTKITLDSFFEDSYNFTSPLESFFKSETYKDKWIWMKTYLIDCATKNSYDGLGYLTDESNSYHNTFLRANIHAFINETNRTEWPKSMDFTNVALRDGYISYLPGKTQEIIYEYTELTSDYTLPNVFRTEYTFLGWYDNNDNLVTTIKAGTKEDIVLNAKYQSIYPIYTITYQTNGGTLSSDAITQFIEKDVVILPIPEKLGYTFYGWYTTSDFSSEKITEIPVGTKQNMTLYANYVKNIYKITYDIDVNNPTSYSIDTPTIVLNTPTKGGYEFLGWYTSAGIKVEEIKTGSTGNLDLVAKFKVIVDDTIKYNVTFIDQNGNTLQEQSVSHGTSASEIHLGTYKDLELGWYLNGKLYDFDTKVTEDITLNAYWLIIDQIYNTVFTSDIISDNLTIKNTFETSIGDINVTWKTSDFDLLNTLTGVISRGYEDKEVRINATFKIGTTSMTVARYFTIAKIVFKDLSGIKPVFAYFYSRVASSEVDEVAGETIDVINYGFARVTSSATVDISELKYIEKITALRNRGIRVLLCIGGYGTACKEFSDAAYTEEGRKTLANSILEVVQQYNFDGVDIDWEYPGYETGRDVSIDRPNYTLLMQEINNTLKTANPEYLVTAAIPGGKYGYSRYELDKLNNILDYFHLMTYDLQASGKASHHTGLYTGSGTPHGSCQQTVDLFYSKGVSKNKLVVGIAFYGRKFNTSSSSIGSSSSTTSAPSITYTDIYNNYLVPIKNGSTTIKRYWDDTTKAPYIYDSSTRVWISYDDPESIKAKCDYVKSNNLGGVMFWDYGEDQTYQLINAIYENMRK